MKGKLLRFMSAFVALPILVSSTFLARDVEAASKTYADDSVTHYEITDVKNEGYYFEPSADGKYQAMIYFHGASDQVKVCDIGNLPERLKNDMNKWIDMGYCDKMVVVTPAIYQETKWGVTEFREFVDNGYLDKLVAELKSGTGIGAKVDTSKPILVAGYSQGGSEALYIGAKRPDTFYNVGAFSPSWCCYNGTSDAWLKKASDFKFSSRTDGHFYISCGAGEDPQFPANYERYLYTASSNGQNISNRFKSHKFSSEFGAHGWKVFEPGTFEFLYYVKNGSVPSEEITVNAVMGKVTISGTASVGNTLTASCVSYYYSSLKYQWYRIDPSTGEASAISGATSNTYTITSADAGYKLRCKVKDKNGGAGYTYKTTDVISSSQPQPTALKGSVTISGNEIRYGYQVTANVSGSNASNFSYQWKRGDSAISGATSKTYTFTESDIGKQISCVVTDKDGKYTGSISSSKTAAVKKAYGPAVPNVTAVDCSKGAKDGKIQNVTTKMEYAYGSQNGPYTACTGTTITGLAKGDYYVRYKETSTAEAGAIAIVTVKEKTSNPITGSVTISGNEIRYGYQVTAKVSGSNASNFKYQWKRGDSAISGATSSTYTFTEADIGKQISCVVTDKDGKYTGSISSAKTAAVKKAYGGVTPNVTAVDCTKGAKDGKILNVTTNMEYACGSQDGPYTACTGTTITGLAKGDYYVRYKETSTTYAGQIAIVTVKEKTSNPITGSVTISGNEIRYSYQVTAKVSGSNASNFSYQWKRGDSAISGATSSTYTFTEADIGKQISCVVTDKDGKYTGSISSAKTDAVKKAYGPAVPNITAVDCTSQGAKDGKILNVTANMEYAYGSQDAAYTACTGTTITGLAKGDYYVRYKETSTTYAGQIAIVTVRDKASGSKSISNATVSSIGNQTYTGSAITPAVTVKDGSKTLVAGTDYTVSYSNNVNAGTATITITGKGNYSGSTKVTFMIVKSGEPVTTGWQSEDGKWYLYDESGVKVTGFADADGKTYYMDETGVMQTRWVEVDNNWYYFNNSGAMQKGWQQIGNKWYYLDSETGAMVTGWLHDGVWYYLNSSGEMLTGWQQIDGDWYYFASSGAMQTRWICSNGTWYYLASSGAMVYSTSIEDGGKTYFFNESGVCTNP